MKKQKRDKFLPLPPPLMFDTLTICFSEKTVSWGGRTVTAKTDCLAIPITNDRVLLIRAETSGWRRIEADDATS